MNDLQEEGGINERPTTWYVKAICPKCKSPMLRGGKGGNVLRCSNCDNHYYVPHAAEHGFDLTPIETPKREEE